MTLSRPSHYPGLLLTGLAHCAVLYFLLHSQRPADAPRARGTAIQWLLPAPTVAVVTRVALSSPPPVTVQPAPPPLRSLPQASAPGNTSTVAEPIAAAPPTSGESAPASDDPFAQSAAPASATNADSILAQARRDAGRIDRELRKTFPVAEPLPPPDSKQARLQRGFDAAHEAVPPKWYQGARMVELSTPGGENKTRTYKITTALVTYCINIYPDGRKSYTDCPR